MAGMVSEVRLLVLNALEPIVCRLAGRVRALIRLLLKAQSPIEVTAEFKVTEVTPAFWNAPLPMVVTPAGRVMAPRAMSLLPKL